MYNFGLPPDDPESEDEEEDEVCIFITFIFNI
jgi:hypothetical protein